jgi:hypothetical protein
VSAAHGALVRIIKIKPEEHDKQAEEEITRIVKEYGWYVALFEANTATPAFAYTVGLWKNLRHPEIISFGLSLNPYKFSP